MTWKTYLTFGAIALIIFLGISLTLSVKRCVSWKKQYSEVKKELELVRKIQEQIRQSDERINQNERTQINIIRNTPDSDIVNELNKLFKSSGQAGVYPVTRQTGTSGSEISGCSGGSNTR